MELHVQEVASRATRTSVTASFDSSWLVEIRKDLIQSSPLDVQLELYGEDGLANVTGVIKVQTTFCCARCLEPVDVQVEAPFHERFRLATNQTTSNDGDIIVVDEDKIDLEPMFEENLLLALPFVPLCKEDCLGLCQTCGVNLNETSCSCKNETIDPRLAALKDLFKDNP